MHWHSTKLCPVADIREFPGDFKGVSFTKLWRLTNTLTWNFGNFLQDHGAVPVSGHMC